MSKNNRSRPPYIRRITDSNFQMETDVRRQGAIPQLYWPLFEFDSEEISYSNTDRIVLKDYNSFLGFEEYSQSIERYFRWKQKADLKLLRYDTQFIIELCSCTTSAYIVDKFFDVAEFDIIIDKLLKLENYPLRKLFIICDSNYDKLRHRITCRNTDEKKVTVDIMISSFSNAGLRYFDIHDRFALLDDEIWHFGWTVCGIGNSLNAYSRGWIDSNGKFREYLNKIVSKS